MDGGGSKGIVRWKLVKNDNLRKKKGEGRNKRCELVGLERMGGERKVRKWKEEKWRA